MVCHYALMDLTAIVYSLLFELVFSEKKVQATPNMVCSMEKLCASKFINQSGPHWHFLLTKIFQIILMNIKESFSVVFIHIRASYYLQVLLL